MAEFFYLGLRRMEGVYLEDFKYRFDFDVTDIYGDVITKLEEQKLICYVNRGKRMSVPLQELTGKSRIRLTEYGIDVSNYVFASFILEEAEVEKRKKEALNRMAAENKKKASKSKADI